MEEIRSSVLNHESMKRVKDSLIRVSEVDGKEKFRIRTVEYINDTANNNKDRFFYDMLAYLRFLTPDEGKGHIAFTTPDKLIFMNCPDAEKGPGEKARVWDFIYCHECMHQLWDTFAVGERIKKNKIEYDHMLLNIASDCVINDYLTYYRKKAKFDDGVFPDVLERKYGVKYDRNKDTQYTLYLKLLKLKQENKEKYKELQEDPQFNGKLIPDHVDIDDGGGGGGPSQSHSDDYKKGWTDGIKDVLDKKVDPKTYNPKEVKNDYDQGYNDVMNKIKEGMEKGVKLSKDSDGNGPSGDLPQIPWDTPPQQSNGNNSDNKKSGNDAAKDAQKSADEAKQSANDAQQKADKSGKKEDQQAADDAKKAAEAAQKAADTAKDAAKNGNDAKANDEAQKAAEAAQDAAASNMSSNEAADSAQKASEEAQKAAEGAQKAAEDAEGKSKKSGSDADKETADAAKGAAEDAKEAAEKAEKFAKEAAKKAQGGDAKGAREAAKAAQQQAELAKGYERIAKNAEEGKTESGQQKTEKTNGGSDAKQGKGPSTGPIIESPEELAELRKNAEEVINKYKKKISGDLGKFIEQCENAAEGKKEGLQVNTTARGNSGWDNKLSTEVNSFVKNRIFSKKREWQSTYSRVKRGSGFVKFGQPIEPGRKIKEDKMDIDVAFYVDKSGSMTNCISQVFDASYIIGDALQKDFGRDPVVDKTEFKMFAFDTRMIPVKWGNKTNASGSTMNFDEILDFITKNTKDYLINVIITDAGFSVNTSKVEKLIEDIDGMIVFVTNVPSEAMKNEAKKHDTKLFYIEADSNFTLDKDM